MATETCIPVTEEIFDFEEALKLSFKKLHNGERVKGIVASVNNKEIIVDTGTKQTGYIPLSELAPADEFKVGDEIEVVVTKINDADGTVLLSRRKLGETASFDTLVKAKNEQTILNGVITNVVNGGILVALLNAGGQQVGLRVFVPTSQTGMPKDTDFNTVLKQKCTFRVLDVNESRRRALGSIRAASKKSIDMAKFWETTEVGSVFKGKVKSFTNYGVFVDLGVVDAMVHISEISYSRVNHPKDVFEIEQEIEVFVKRIDKEKHKVALGYKKAEDDPWIKFTNDYKLGDMVEATVIAIKSFGAFATVIPGVDALIHISQCADRKIANVTDVLHEGDKVKGMIVAMSLAERRLNLSLKTDAVPETPKPVEVESEVTEEVAATAE
ncbi:MAG: S1 RNA-binding domain-containing protein [Oscillospiraceae bacterium]|jgi:4-hydroxy-3-methylbut-2-enyl diphosphate reductase|nr:S1 RNA-binding domain-containing protein [Oscillospiraceae bacterium]